MCHLLVGRQNRPTLLQPAFSSLCSLGSCKTTCDSLSPLQFLLPYQLIPNTQLLCICVGVFSHFTLVQNVLTVCTLFSMCLQLLQTAPLWFFSCTQGYSLTHTHPISQCTKKHISYSSKHYTPSKHCN